jgi:hypothetical protein
MKLGIIGVVMVGLLGAVGCAVAEGDPEPESEVVDSELRGFKPGELAGSIGCGETKRVHHAGTPTYRALSIAAKKGQVLDVKVSAPGHDARAWLTTASNATRTSNDNGGGGLDARIVYTAKSTTTHHVVFREKSSTPDVDFDVTLTCDGVPVEPPTPSDPFLAASCPGPAITREQAIAKIGAGNTFRVVAPATKLMARKRSCNAVTGCSAWGPTEPAAHNYYMASGGDNYNKARQYDVHLMMSVVGADIEAVVEDVSSRAHCAGCTPSGIALNLSSGKIHDFHNDAALFIYYPRWNHTSSGFRIMDEWASVPLGPATTTSMTVNVACTRATVLSKDGQTEYGVLYRY